MCNVALAQLAIGVSFAEAGLDDAPLLVLEALGAGREFNVRMIEIQGEFAALITRHLNELVAAGIVAPLDTNIAGIAWFGGVNEVVRRWVLTDQPAKLEDTYPALRDLLRRSIGQTST